MGGYPSFDLSLLIAVELNKYSNSTTAEEEDITFTKKLFLGVNATCLIIYTALVAVLLWKLRKVPIERRTLNIIFAFFIIFLCK